VLTVFPRCLANTFSSHHTLLRTRLSLLSRSTRTDDYCYTLRAYFSLPRWRLLGYWRAELAYSLTYWRVKELLSQSRETSSRRWVKAIFLVRWLCESVPPCLDISQSKGVGVLWVNLRAIHIQLCGLHTCTQTVDFYRQRAFFLVWIFLLNSQRLVDFSTFWLKLWSIVTGKIVACSKATDRVFDIWMHNSTENNNNWPVHLCESKLINAKKLNSKVENVCLGLFFFVLWLLLLSLLENLTDIWRN